MRYKAHESNFINIGLHIWAIKHCAYDALFQKKKTLFFTLVTPKRIYPYKTQRRFFKPITNLGLTTYGKVKIYRPTCVFYE